MFRYYMIVSNPSVGRIGGGEGARGWSIQLLEYVSNTAATLGLLVVVVIASANAFAIGNYH